MSPLYEYRCGEGHVTIELRSFDERDRVPGCERCGGTTVRVMSVPAKRTDGIYSYAPNTGSEQKFERQREAIKEGRSVIDGAHDE